ncbi:Protein SPAS-1 a [Aphelenchoides avenae]|nr:Protein SPAS-1 a [Aphelenchus avenae]
MEIHEARRMASDVMRKQAAYRACYERIQSSSATISGHYFAKWYPPWIGRMWNQKVETNTLVVKRRSVVAKEVLRPKVEKNADGQLIASVRLLDTQFPFMMTVNTGRHTYRVVDFLFAMVVCADWGEVVSITVHPLPFGTASELTDTMSQLATAVFVNDRGVIRTLEKQLEEERLLRQQDLAEKARIEEEKLAGMLNLHCLYNTELGKRASRGILLYGPPGNGKTMLVKAMAAETGLPFFSISSASIMDKYVGESERKVQELFEDARRNQPSIIFIDEMDALLSSRGDFDGGVATRVKTQFLNEIDGALTAEDNRVFVIGATNCPHVIDDAMKRRLPTRIFIRLPDQQARAGAVKKLLDDENKSYRITDEKFKCRD